MVVLVTTDSAPRLSGSTVGCSYTRCTHVMKYDALADISCVRGFQLQAELAASVSTPNSSCARLWVTCRPSAVPHWSQVGGSKQRVFEKTASVLLQRTEPCRPVLCNTAQIQESGLQEIKMWPPACVCEYSHSDHTWQDFQGVAVYDGEDQQPHTSISC